MVNRVTEKLKEIGGGVLLVTGCCVGVAITPLVSLVAFPIFALQTISSYVGYKRLYNVRKLNPFEFGRIQGQDYTKWNGKFVDIKSRQLFEARQLFEYSYYHGSEDARFTNYFFQNNAFKTQEDLDWLNKEHRFIIAKYDYESLKTKTRVFFKTLFPIIGLIWVLGTENLPFSLGGCGKIKCTCDDCGDNEKFKNWSIVEALEYQQSNLSKYLKNPNEKDTLFPLPPTKAVQARQKKQEELVKKNTIPPSSPPIEKKKLDENMNKFNITPAEIKVSPCTIDIAMFRGENPEEPEPNSKTYNVNPL